MKVMTFCISWLNNCLSLSSWRGLAMMARRLDVIVLSRVARGDFDACAISRKTCRYTCVWVRGMDMVDRDTWLVPVSMYCDRNHCCHNLQGLLVPQQRVCVPLQKDNCGPAVDNWPGFNFFANFLKTIIKVPPQRPLPMVRFRCPTTTSSFASVGSASSESNPRRADRNGRVSKVAKMTLRADPISASSSSCLGKKRKRSTSDEQKKAMIKEALRLDQLRQSVKKREFCFVYVGNIPPTATEASLRNQFRKCGSIQDICIRCSSGAAVLIGQAHPYRTPHDRQYATIMFTQPKAVAKALKLNGLEMHGFKIMVCLSAAQLPEMTEIIRWRLNAINERKGVPARSNPTGYKGLMPSPTERVVQQNDTIQPDASTADGQAHPPKSLVRNFMFWNMTFPKTVM